MERSEAIARRGKYHGRRKVRVEGPRAPHARRAGHAQERVHRVAHRLPAPFARCRGRHVYGARMPINRVNHASPMRAPSPSSVGQSQSAPWRRPSRKPPRLNPIVEGALLRLPIPALNADGARARESRPQVADSTVAVRNCARWHGTAQRLDKGGQMSEAHHHRPTNVQELTDKLIKEVDQSLAAKENEIADSNDDMLPPDIPPSIHARAAAGLLVVWRCLIHERAQSIGRRRPAQPSRARRDHHGRQRRWAESAGCRARRASHGRGSRAPHCARSDGARHPVSHHLHFSSENWSPPRARSTT